MIRDENFTELYDIGKKNAQPVVQLLEGFGFKVVETTKEDDKKGKDYIVTRPNGSSFTLESKSDREAYKYNNFFIETEEHNAPGWAYTCQADYISHYFPVLEVIYINIPLLIREKLPEWLVTYKHKIKTLRVQGLYEVLDSKGVCVPMKEIDKIKIRKYKV